MHEGHVNGKTAARFSSQEELKEVARNYSCCTQSVNTCRTTGKVERKVGQV